MKKFHELKILDKYYQDVVVKRIKQFEIRKNDRDYQVGDIVSFTNVDGKNRPRKSYFLITYVLKDIPEYGLHKDYCIFGIKWIYDTVEGRRNEHR